MASELKSPLPPRPHLQMMEQVYFFSRPRGVPPLLPPPPTFSLLPPPSQQSFFLSLHPSTPPPFLSFPFGSPVECLWSVFWGAGREGPIWPRRPPDDIRAKGQGGQQGVTADPPTSDPPWVLHTPRRVVNGRRGDDAGKEGEVTRVAETTTDGAFSGGLFSLLLCLLPPPSFLPSSTPTSSSSAYQPPLPCYR